MADLIARRQAAVGNALGEDEAAIAHHRVSEPQRLTARKVAQTHRLRGAQGGRAAAGPALQPQWSQSLVSSGPVV